MKKIILILILLFLGNSIFAIENCNSTCSGSEKMNCLKPFQGYCKNNGTIYFYGKKMEGASEKNLIFLDFPFSKNKKYFYFGEEIINGFDSKSFKIINNYYFKDKNNLYSKEDLSFKKIDWQTQKLLK